MSKSLPWIILICLATTLLAISFWHTQFLSDQNSFLKNFVADQLLATLGFILTVTLASAASLHLELNKIEDATSKLFTRSRVSIRRSAYSLLVMFAVGTILVIVKPLLPSEPINSAIANTIAILIIYFNLSVLHDLTRTVFAIPSITAIKAMDDASKARLTTSGEVRSDV